MRKAVGVGVVLVVFVVGCGDVAQQARSVITAITSSSTPRAISEKIADGFKTFWRSVQSAPRAVTKELSQVPRRANVQVRKLRTGLASFLSSASHLVAKADGSGCAVAGLKTDGDAYCVEQDGASLAVFCDGGEAYALDCGTLADGATCGELDELIDCVSGPATTAASAASEDVATYSVDSGSLRHSVAPMCLKLRHWRPG